MVIEVGKNPIRRRRLGAWRMERHFHDSFFNVVRIDRRDRKKEKEIETERLERGQKNRNGSISFGESFSQE